MAKGAQQIRDIKAYDRAMRRKHEFVPLEIALEEAGITRNG